MHSLLEEYLSEVAIHLSALPVARRSEELREMRTHLENAVIVSRELGQSEDDAAQTAVEQFGTPETVGQSMVEAWRRGESLRKRDFWGAAACTLVLSYLLSFLVGQMEQTYILYAKPGSHSSAAVWVGLFGLAYAAPVLVGGVSGILFPKRAVMGAGLATVVYSIFRAALVYHQFAGMHMNAQFLRTVVICTGLDFVISALLTLLTAWAGSRWREARTGRARVAQG